LGAGGSGVVYLANDVLLQRPVVLKILRTGLLSPEQLRSTVLREARLASAIEHPNVCAIYEVGESGDEGYIVMQYVPASRSTTSSPAAPPACNWCFRLAFRLPTVSRPRTRWASSIATSSPRTLC